MPRPAVIIGRMTPSPLAETLQRVLRGRAPAALCVAFSGGPDSTALLHALAQLPAARTRGLRALHVDHGLHPDSADWARHCAVFCKALNVPLTTLRVTADDTFHEGVEAAARRVRFAAFAGNLGAGEWLALAHHRDDQVETVLLKLLRGAGPEGLGGMRTLRPFAQGYLWRPLLETPRTAICMYLITKDLHSINDPANSNPHYLRNELRHTVLPCLRERWPQADASVLHAARLCRAAAEYIAEAASTALATLQHEAGSLDADGWLALPDALRAPVLDEWLHARGFTAPPDRARAELEKQTTHAAADRSPAIHWPGTEVHVWNGHLYVTPPLPPPLPTWQAAWDGTPIALPAGGALTLVSRDGDGVQNACLQPALTLRLRRGGERIRPAGHTHTRELRDLFREARVPPWLRTRCPLICLDGELIAAADLWQSERGQALFAAIDAQPRWQRPGVR